VVDDAVAMEAVATRVGDEALDGPGLILGRSAEQVAGEPASDLREMVMEKLTSAA
jgi:hypothetical protein